METQTKNVITMEVPNVTTEKRELTLPFYCKRNMFYYKVFTENHCLTITAGKDVTGNGIEISPASRPFNFINDPDWQEITEEQFYEQYIIVSDIIKGMIL